MTLNQLIYFKTITEYGSLAKASEHLFVSQSALSKALKELEDELGTELFQRSSKGLILNADGKKLLELATPVIESFDNIKPEMDKFSGETGKVIAVDSYYTFVYEVLSPMLLNRYHDVKLDLKLSERQAGLIIEDIKSGKLDCAVIGINDPDIIKMLQQDTDNGIESINIFKDQLYLAVPKTHNVYQKKTVKADEILQNRLVSNFNAGHIDRWFQSIMRKKNLPLDYRHVMDQNTFMKAWFVFDYDFITGSVWASNERFCKDFYRHKDLIKLDEPEATEQIMFIYNKESNYISAVKDDVIRKIYRHFQSKMCD